MVVDPTIENIRARLARIRTGGALRVVDLFSGCGGMSLGLKRAGYDLSGGIEINPQATATYAQNLFRGASEEEYALHTIPHDITDFSPERFLREVLGGDDPEGLVDVIAGGPPCQAFSRIGRAKLRAVRQHPEAFRVDERSSLYLHYLDYVEFFRPLAVIMENVTDIMNYGGKNVAEEIAVSLEELGYRCRYTILNTVHYGIPQLRLRFYLIAFLNGVQVEPYFPAPTHFLEKIPHGYLSARLVALSTMPPDLFRAAQSDFFRPVQSGLRAVQPDLFGTVHYVDMPHSSETDALKQAVVVRDALADLPPLKDHLEQQMRRGARRFTQLLKYVDGELSEYAREMREWEGFESAEGVVDHVIRYLPRDYPIFQEMEYDDQYPEAHRIAIRRFERELERLRQEEQRAIEDGSEEYKELLKAMVPPYDVGKFPNKWWKLNPARPSRTLTAHMGKDTYTHIHYDGSQGRVISVREAARLQSFPDGFRFAGAMNAAFTQIGNAVAPKQAFVLGEHIKSLLVRAAQEVNAAYTLAVQKTPMGAFEAKQATAPGMPAAVLQETLAEVPEITVAAFQGIPAIAAEA